MKKIVLAAAAVALFSAPAFAAPEPFNINVGANGQFTSSPPSGQESEAAAPSRAHTDMNGSPQDARVGSAAWSRAEAPSNNPQMMQASDDQAKPMKKHHRRHKKPAAPAANEAPKASESTQPAAEGQQ